MVFCVLERSGGDGEDDGGRKGRKVWEMVSADAEAAEECFWKDLVGWIVRLVFI